MADRSQNIDRRLQASASMSSVGGQDDAEIPRFNRVHDTLPQLAESASQSQTIQPVGGRRVCRSCTVIDEEEDVIPLESDTDMDPEGAETEVEDDDSGGEEDEGADDVPESQHQNDHATASTPAAHAIPAVLTDPDVLDCPICLDPLVAPIYQCENGHIACSSCCTKINKKCPSCSLPIGFNRCRAMERLIESVTVDCKNKVLGCRERLIYHRKAMHEQGCMYTLSCCPISSCGYIGSFKHVYNHFSTQHLSSAIPFSYGEIINLRVRISQNHVIMREYHEGVIFILNHEIREHGRVFNVDCVGPDIFKNDIVYKLSVRCLKTCFSVESVPEVYAKWEEHTPNKNCLTIPSEFVRFTIDVCIERV